jgi:gamma-glutamylputrescine oxidase
VTSHVDHGRAGTPLWAAGDLAPPPPDTPPLDEHLSADLCVVGLGGTGLAAVAAGVEAGLRVVGLDAGPVAGAAAGRNGGLLLAGMAAFHHDAVSRHGRERAVAWYRATMAMRDRMVAADPTAVRRTGSLRVAADEAEAGDLAAMATAMEADDLPVERVDHDLGPALHFPDDAACNPLARCRREAADLVAAGARLAAHSPVRSIEPGRVVTDRATVAADTTVVCVDGGLAHVVPAMAGTVRPVRLQMVGTAPVSTVVPQPVYVRWGLDYWQQLPDGRLAVGGGRDRGGEAEEGADPSPSAPVQAWLDHLVTAIDPRAEITHRWAAVVGFTRDGLPVCGQVDEGVWVVGGHSGTGNVVGPMLAREAVAWARTGTPTPLLQALYGA